MPFLSALGLATPLAKAIAVGLLLLAIAGAVIGFVMHERAIGIAEEKDRQHNADMDWLKKAQDIGAEAQAKANALIARLDQLKKERDAAKQTSDRLSAGNDRRLCFDDAAAARLRARGALQSSHSSSATAAGVPGAGGAHR